MRLWLPKLLQLVSDRARRGWTDGLRALRAPPRAVFERRTGSEASAPPAAAKALRAAPLSLTIHAVEPAARDAVRIAFEWPAGAPAYRPGQFLTFDVPIDGVHHRRHYSFATVPPPNGGAHIAAVIVRRVVGGVVSNHLADHACAGWVLDAVGPSGRFGESVARQPDREVVLVAGGAGITPLWSIAQERVRAGGRVRLIYANRGVQRIIAKRAIDDLAAQHPNFDVVHVLERASKRVDGPVGRLDGPGAERWVPASASASYYVCGPTPMMDAVERSLVARGVDRARIERETFTPPSPGPTSDVEHVVRFVRSNTTLQVRGDQSILAAAQAAGLAMNFSCAMGGCAACKVRAVRGDVHMPEPHCLTEAERAAGDLLACIATPRSDLVLDA